MKTALSLIPLIMAVMLCGCSDDSPTDAIELYDIACMENTGSNGTVFTLCKPDNDNPITLTSSQKVDTAYVKPGERLLIKYIPQNGTAYTSGEIALKGYGTIINGKLSLATEDADINSDITPIYMLSCWRAGNYLNMHLKLPYDNTPRKFSLVLPFGQLTEEYPDVYLVHALETDVNTFDRAYYASFDISYLISGNKKGFTLHFNDTNLCLNEMHFNLNSPNN